MYITLNFALVLYVLVVSNSLMHRLTGNHFLHGCIMYKQAAVLEKYNHASYLLHCQHYQYDNDTVTISKPVMQQGGLSDITCLLCNVSNHTYTQCALVMVRINYCIPPIICMTYFKGTDRAICYS